MWVYNECMFSFHEGIFFNFKLHYPLFTVFRQDLNQSNWSTLCYFIMKTSWNCMIPRKKTKKNVNLAMFPWKFLCLQFNVVQKLWGMEPSPILRNGKQKTWTMQSDQRIFIRVFPKIGVPQNGWFIMEIPIRMGWFGGYHYFRKHPSTWIFHDFIWLHYWRYPPRCIKLPSPMSVLGFQVHPPNLPCWWKEAWMWVLGSWQLPNICWTTRWYFWNASSSSVQLYNL